MNGAASVCASVFGVVISVFFGISAAFWTGAAAYMVAAVAMAVIARVQRMRAPAADESVPLEVPSPVTV
jgi:hypothetical protein